MKTKKCMGKTNVENIVTQYQTSRYFCRKKNPKLAEVEFVLSLGLDETVIVATVHAAFIALLY